MGLITLLTKSHEPLSSLVLGAQASGEVPGGFGVSDSGVPFGGFCRASLINLAFVLGLRV